MRFGKTARIKNPREVEHVDIREFQKLFFGFQNGGFFFVPGAWNLVSLLLFVADGAYE